MQKFMRGLTCFLVSGSTSGSGALDSGKSLIVDKKNSSHGANINMPSPSFPFLPVRPSRCIYCCLSAGTPIYNRRNEISHAYMVNGLHFTQLNHRYYCPLSPSYGPNTMTSLNKIEILEDSLNLRFCC